MSQKLVFLLLAFQFSAILAIEIVDYRKLDVLWEASTFCNFVMSILPSTISENCAAHLNVSCQNPEVIETILDASSRFPYSGLKTSIRYGYGNFDECLAVDHKYSGGRILGKHCFGGLVIPDMMNVSNLDDAYLLSICYPSGCTSADYNVIVQTFFQTVLRVPYPGIFIDNYCTTKEDKLDWAAEDYITTTLIGTCVGLMIISTVYDLYLNRVNKKSAHPLLLAFSVYSNGKKLLQTSKFTSKSEQILVFHGLKAISMSWVVAGHGISMVMISTLENYNYLSEYTTYFYPFYITSAIYAVDTFFWISGFLMAYQYLKMKNKSLKSHILGVPVNIIHRYIRLTPAALMVFLFTISLFARIGNGPKSAPVVEYFQTACKKYWWTYFLYIQNYYNYTDQDLCVPPTWYLSADMQMFLLSPLVLIPLAVVLRNTKKLKICMLGLAALSVLCLIISIAIKLHFRDYNNGYETHPRLVVYITGIMMGAFMRETKNRPFISSKLDAKKLFRINLALWVVALSGLLGMVLWEKYVELHGGYEYQAIFINCSRVVWSASLCWIVYSSYYGYGGFINWILTRPIMQILSKISYSVYLVHSLVIAHYYMVGRAKTFFNDYEAFHHWCGFQICSVIVAFFLTLGFESPLIIIERYIFGGRKTLPKQQPKTVAENLPEDINIEEGFHQEANIDKATSSKTKDS